MAPAPWPAAGPPPADGTPPLPTPPRHWGLGDAALGLVIGNVATAIAVVALVATGAIASSSTTDLSIAWVALLQVPLWVGLLGVPLWASKTKGRGVVEDFGLRFAWADVPVGIAVGVITQLVVIPVLYIPLLRLFNIDENKVSEVARDLTDKAHGAGGVLLLTLVVVVGAPIIEELFFRGLVLRSIENRFGTTWAVIGSGVAFGLVHFEAIQLPALVLFGIVLGYLAVRTGRLGPAIVAHMAFNAVTVITLLR